MLSSLPSSPPRDPARSSQLSAGRRQLISVLWDVHFGRVEELHVRRGEPLFAPRPRVIRTVKVAGNKVPKPPALETNVELKREWLDVLRELDALGDGVVRRIEVAHGLPLFMEIVDPEPAV